VKPAINETGNSLELTGTGGVPFRVLRFGSSGGVVVGGADAVDLSPAQVEALVKFLRPDTDR
jgi:hypothetical protein